MKKISIIFFALLLIISCSKKKEESPEGFRGGVSMPPQLGIKMGKTHVVVPDEVNKVWKSVSIEVFDKESNESKKFNIDIGKEFTIPGSDIKVKIEVFLPTLKIMEYTKI